MQQVEIIDIENKKYMVLNEITDNGETYLYLTNVKNPKDFIIQKVDKNDKDYLINLDNDEEFQKALNLFSKKIDEINQ